MAEDSDLEKTEEASPRRLEKAREEGQIARSRELGTFMLLAAGTAILWAGGALLGEKLSAVVRLGMDFDQRIVRDTHVMMAQAVYSATQALWIMLPIFGILCVVAVFSSTILGGFIFSTEALIPKFSKLSFTAGLGRIFSSQTLVELFKAIAKALLIGGIGAYVIWHHHQEMLNLMHAAPQQALAKMLSVVALCLSLIVASLGIIVLLDVPWQVWNHMKKLRMSKEDLRQEHKETEGDPQIKSRIRQQQRALARKRMMAKVPTADVVVTNPLHYAVALKYVEGENCAPQLIAKGTGLIAANIRQLAREHRIPTLEAPPLARALYKHVELDQEIPISLYTAVAEVLAWVFQLRAWNPSMGTYPISPENLPVPSQLDPQGQSLEPGMLNNV